MLSAPLHRAVYQNNIELVNLLIAHKADMNVQNTYGLTPLHIAITNKNYEIAFILLDNGADKTITNNMQKTAINLFMNDVFKINVAKLLLY